MDASRAVACLAALALVSCERLPHLETALGGDTTIADASPQAFGFSARNLDLEGRRRFEVGDSFFNRNWVVAPASTAARDGLGPTFNAAACSSCHLRDGRAQPPGSGEPGLIHRLSLPGSQADGSPVPVPEYGLQLQDLAIPGVRAEGRVEIDWSELPGELADGTPYSLARPSYRFVELALGPLPDSFQHSARVAPGLPGSGLLEAIPEESLLARADPDDRDGDGISGRPNWVTDPRTGLRALGRFGWKAGAFGIEHQVAMAAHQDLGLTSAWFPDQNCAPSQTACRSAPSGGEPELSAARLDDIGFYSRTLAVPARRSPDDTQARRGASHFERIGCARCHVPEHRTGEHSIAALARQRIFPYTDLLLHDLGEKLSDGRAEHQALPGEWRTPPLWGIGLVPVVNGHRRLLHDGRARGFEEAILWHGGEAEHSRDRYVELSRGARADLLRFLENL